MDKVRLNRQKKIGGVFNACGQVSLELAAALLCILILLVGTINLFIWVNSHLVLRQESYDERRVDAGSSKDLISVTGLHKFIILKEGPEVKIWK